jgi:hypothetical protein
MLLRPRRGGLQRGRPLTHVPCTRARPCPCPCVTPVCVTRALPSSACGRRRHGGRPPLSPCTCLLCPHHPPKPYLPSPVALPPGLCCPRRRPAAALPHTVAARPLTRRAPLCAAPPPAYNDSLSAPSVAAPCRTLPPSPCKRQDRGANLALARPPPQQTSPLSPTSLLGLLLPWNAFPHAARLRRVAAFVIERRAPPPPCAGEPQGSTTPLPSPPLSALVKPGAAAASRARCQLSTRFTRAAQLRSSQQRSALDKTWRRGRGQNPPLGGRAPRCAANPSGPVAAWGPLRCPGRHHTRPAGGPQPGPRLSVLRLGRLEGAAEGPGPPP